MSSLLSPTFIALSTLLIAVGVGAAMGFFSSTNHFNVSGSTVIVTGGSQGLGLEVAKQLAAKGANVIIVAQNVSKLEKAISEIRSCAQSQSQRFLQLSFDLRSPDSGSAIVKQATDWNNGQPPDVLFNVAGLCIPGFFATSDIETLRGQMDTVYWSCAYMAHAVLQSWTQPGSKSPTPKPTRHIIFTSSVLGLYAIAGYAPYTPAKAAMRALHDTLTQEVEVYNGARRRNAPDAPAADIKIHTIYPCGIRSPGYENEEKLKPALTKMLEKDDRPQEPKDVARIAIERLEAGDTFITTMLIGHLLKGVGMGGSVRSGISDVFWNALGSLAIIFVAPDMMSKCRNWGKSHGMAGAH